MPAKSTYNNTPCTVNGLEVRLVKNNSGTARKTGRQQRAHDFNIHAFIGRFGDGKT